MVSTSETPTKRVAILLENSFEDSEFQIPQTALKQAGAEVIILGSRMNDEYKGKRGKVTAKPNATATEVRAEDFDAIVIPGGVAPDKIRTNPNAVSLVAEAMNQNKLIAAICHGPQVLIEANLLQGKRATGFRAIRQDLINAGADYLDEPIVIDGNLITARQPGDLAIFTAAILTRLQLDALTTKFPDLGDRTFEWREIAEIWGGSTRREVVNALDTAITGESYTAKAFELYADKISNPQLKALFSEIRTTKQQHAEQLKARLATLNEQASWQVAGAEAVATLQGWLQGSDEIEILRKALGDIQTGVVDCYHLCSQITDPITVSLLSDIESKLSQYEVALAKIYRDRMGTKVQSPLPTTMAVVS